MYNILNGSKASLFADDFALCIHAKSLRHAERLMQRCETAGVQDMILTMGLNFPLR